MLVVLVQINSHTYVSIYYLASHYLMHPGILERMADNLVLYKQHNDQERGGIVRGARRESVLKEGGGLWNVVILDVDNAATVPLQPYNLSRPASKNAVEVKALCYFGVLSQ